MKSEAQAKLFKKKGDEVYLKFQYRDALIEYNRALCYAESNKLKSHLYRDRSTIFFMVKRYDMCIKNIQLAKKFGYPLEKMAKLIAREEKCKELMKSSNERVIQEEAAAEFFKLSYESHSKVPFIIEGIEVKTSEKYGNHLITTRDLKTGDIIAIEPFLSYFASLRTEFIHEYCSLCLRHNYLNLIPCDSCVQTMYCSESCKEQHNLIAHKFLCGTMECFPMFEVCLRMLMTGINEFGSFKEFYKLFNHPVKKTVFDFDEITAKNYVSIISSLTMASNHQHQCKTMFLPTFDQIVKRPPFKEFYSTKEELEDVFDCIHRVISIHATNAVALGETRLKNGRTWYIDTFGSRVGAFVSLFNHSCDPNIGRITVGNKLVFYVTRPIKAGEQIFISYGPEFGWMPFNDRRLKLFGYDIVCDCNACRMNIPIMSGLAKIMGGSVDPPPPENCDKHQLISYFKKNCEFIDDHQKDHPCFETTNKHISNNHILFQIAKDRL